VIGRTADESTPAWPAPVRAGEGAPNVLFIVLDDTGFGQLRCYGSPIETPSFDALAADGLRYSNMHTTALCSPSRSCILTGRNHHSNAMACITELASGYPGYNGVIPFENGFLSEMLLEHGYSTFMVGKYHLTPSNQETGAGPFDRWPLGRGFQRYYGFLGGDTSQWYPDLVYDNHQVEPPRPGSSTARTASPPTSRSPQPGPRECCCARAPRPADTRCSSRTASSATSTTKAVHNYVGRAVYGVESDQVLPPGPHALRFEFEPTGEPDMAHGRGAPGRLQLYVDGTLAGNAEAPFTTPFVLNPGALTCGANPGSAITDDYASPFKFTGTIHSVTVDLSGKLIEDTEAELRMHMARQ
jgi:hypothetical protein